MNPLEQHLAGRLRATRPSETLLINELSKRLISANHLIYRFGFGENPFPVPEHVVTALRTAAHRKEYTNVQGLLELRLAISDFHNTVEGHDWKPEQLIVGAGSKILLFCLMAALTSADIALPAPSWVSYEPQAKLAGHTVLRIQTRYEDNWQITPDQLESLCASRADSGRPLVLILNYPGNPDGRCYDATTLEAFAAILRRRRVLVISDEIYGLLHHNGSHRSLAHYYPEGTVVSTGLSKWCGAGGWRLGAVRIPPELGDGFFQRVLGIASETFSSASTPVQLAGVAAYNDSAEIRGYLQTQRSIFKDIGNHCARRLQNAGVRVSSPEGGFYLFPDFSPFLHGLSRRGITTSSELVTQLLRDTGVALLPGSAFGMPEDSLTARLAYVDFNGEKALQTGQADTEHLYKGIEAICQWVQE